MWDVTTKKVRTQLIAHDKEVYDLVWSPRQADVFATVGADGSLRMFDLRDLEHSTIMYETGGGALALVHRREAEALLDRALVQGRPQDPRPGRADDFSWPRR